MDGTVSVDEGLQPLQFRVGIALVVDLDTDVEPAGDLGRIQAEPRRVRGQRLVPCVGIGDAADGHHHADAGFGEVVDDLLGHGDRHAVDGDRVRGHVQKAHGVYEAQDDQVDRRQARAVASVDDPAIGRVELDHVPGQRPVRVVVAGMPDAVDLHLCPFARRRRFVGGAGAEIRPGRFVCAGDRPGRFALRAPLMGAVSDDVAPQIAGGCVPLGRLACGARR